ncbi:hypothetical protein [uncultured Phocaeicola sp.]|uniref:hypothetical protein n=1 Tax=uncultured Phocaeicola sp. TaxID=990718 RepID=UPI0014350328|nr:hypothetical protein [uncultured Phocaeicola sp.]GFI00055.1 hypothetical protein IMSAGC004_02462 [Bacteroidaceae bacterium]
MKENRFLNLSGEIPVLSKDEADLLKGGFKKVPTKLSIQMNSDDTNKNCHGNIKNMDSDGGDTNINCKFSCECDQKN